MEKDTIESKDTATVYEVSYLLLPHLSPADALEKASKIKEKIATVGTVISHEDPILIDLAYQMTKVSGATRHKVHSGYFGWIKFESDKEVVKSIEKSLADDALIVRHLMVKTVKENTLLHGKMKLKSEEKAKKDETKEEEPGEVVEAEGEVAAPDLDKSIDDLVIA